MSAHIHEEGTGYWAGCRACYNERNAVDAAVVTLDDMDALSAVPPSRFASEGGRVVTGYPLLDERYDAAKAAGLGSQLRADEVSERVRVELENAFAAGALWQYDRDRRAAS